MPSEPLIRLIEAAKAKYGLMADLGEDHRCQVWVDYDNYAAGPFLSLYGNGKLEGVKLPIPAAIALRDFLNEHFSDMETPDA